MDWPCCLSSSIYKKWPPKCREPAWFSLHWMPFSISGVLNPPHWVSVDKGQVVWPIRHAMFIRLLSPGPFAKAVTKVHPTVWKCTWQLPRFYICTFLKRCNYALNQQTGKNITISSVERAVRSRKFFLKCRIGINFTALPVRSKLLAVWRYWYWFLYDF